MTPPKSAVKKTNLNLTLDFYNLHQHALDHSLVILMSLCVPFLVTLEGYQWRFAHLHVFTLNSSQFPHPSLHMYPTQKVLFLIRLQIGSVSLPEHLLKIVCLN